MVCFKRFSFFVIGMLAAGGLQAMDFISSEREKRGKDLLAAAQHNNYDAIKPLIAKGASADYRDAHGWTPLMTAAYWGNPMAVKVLLECGADVHASDDWGQNALVKAYQGRARAQKEFMAECKELDRHIMVGGVVTMSADMLHYRAIEAMLREHGAVYERGFIYLWK